MTQRENPDDWANVNRRPPAPGLRAARAAWQRGLRALARCSAPCAPAEGAFEDWLAALYQIAELDRQRAASLLYWRKRTAGQRLGWTVMVAAAALRRAEIASQNAHAALRAAESRRSPDQQTRGNLSEAGGMP